MTQKQMTTEEVQADAISKILKLIEEREKILIAERDGLRQQNERMKAAMLEAIEHSGVPGYVESILREALSARSAD